MVINQFLKWLPLLYFFISSLLMAEVIIVEAPSNIQTLKLETQVIPETLVYPGQKLQFIYRIYYNSSIDLTLEQLPLLDAEGFQKIGQKEIKDSITGNLNVQEIKQEVRALTPGSFSFPLSIIEGRAYEEDSQGQHLYNPAKLRSETPSFSLTVLPFPSENRPNSFSGALGNYFFKTQLLTPNVMSIGDEIQLSIEIFGSGDMETVLIPDISCQPGFSGFFQIATLPTIHISQTSKQFIQTLRPMVNAIQEIPSIEFSSFDVKTHQYSVLHSQPIPIAVKELPVVEEPAKKPATPLQNPAIALPMPWKSKWEHPQSSELQPNVSSELTEANALYLAAEKNPILSQREQGFNQALALYGKANQDADQGALHYNMANTYFQLQEYPLAIFHYYRAQYYQPADVKIQHNLNLAQSKLGITPSSLTKKFISLIPYFSPIEGVILQSTLLHRGPGDNYSIVSSRPPLSGEKVQVLDMNATGHWLKIMLPNGNIGYINSKTIRLL